MNQPFDDENLSFLFFMLGAKAKIFNDKLQQFALKISYISGLETGGKISPDQAFKHFYRK